MQFELIESKFTFNEAWVTNTRYMGEVCLSADLGGEMKYFLLDAQDGLEILDDDISDFLGGKSYILTEKECRYLIKESLDKTPQSEKNSSSQYDKLEEFAGDVKLTDEEMSALDLKIYCKIHTEKEAINYFIMRVLCGDFEAARKLTGHAVRIAYNIPRGELFHNVIEDYANEYHDVGDESFKTRKSFICTSLIWEQNYYLIRSLVTLENKSVEGFEIVSCDMITAWEADNITATSEYVCTYDSIGQNFFDNLPHAQITPHEAGVSYMIFNPDNSHVDSKVYSLGDDVFATIYVQEGQLIIASRDPRHISYLERDLPQPTGAYVFSRNILGGYIESGAEDFTDFVDSLT